MQSKDEYLMLRNEILQIYNIVHGTRSILYLFVSGIVSYAFVNNKLGLLLLPHIVIIPMYLIAIDYTRDMYRIGTYLQVFHEGKDFNWETRQYKLNYTIKNKMIRFAKVFHLPYLTTSVSCFLCFLYKSCSGNPNILIGFVTKPYENIKTVIYIIIILIELIITLIIYFKYRDMTSIQKNYYTSWNEIKLSEQ